MSGFVINLDDLVIANGQTASNVLIARLHYRDAFTLTFYSPATLPETVTLQASNTEDGSSGWFNVSRAGADFLMTIGKALTLEEPNYTALRLLAGGAVAAQRTFKVTKEVWA